MKKVLLGVFLSLIILKILLAGLVTVPLGYSDSLAYMEQAKIFHDTGSVIATIETAKFPPLYAIIISPAYYFQDMNAVFFAIKIINILLSSLAIFPAYFLSREFFKKKTSLILATLTAFLPFTWTVTFYPFYENLYIPLLLTTIYFLYKALTEEKKKWAIILVVSIVLCILTRTLGIILFAALVLLGLYFLINRNKKQVQRIGIILISSIILSLAYFYKAYNFLSSGYGGEVETASQIGIYLTKILWVFIYTNYLSISLGIIGFILLLQAYLHLKEFNQKEKIFLVLILCISVTTIFLAANNSGNTSISEYNEHRIIGRYISTILPFLIIGSALSFQKFKKIKKTPIIITSMLLLILTPLSMFGTFYPINNTELILIEILKIIFHYPNIFATIGITIILFGLSISTLFLKKVKINTLFTILLIYFIIVSLLNTGAITYDSEIRWEQLEEVQIGNWINKNLPPNASFIIDKNNLECFEQGSNVDRTEENDRPLAVIAYWIRGEIKNRDEILFPCSQMESYENYDYLITTKELNLEKVKEGENIKIYKVNGR
ncbi:glycosyltransferase family 39 protein [Candidatus Woesearchaeota archaeon]|nr:glycosyltransferase family 39 protein [Candidatus Woesearchaeota archaeon]